MKSFNYTIKDAQGIHARPAGLLVKEVQKLAGAKVTIEKEGKAVDASRLMALMSLGIKCGQEVTVSVEGDNEDAAFEAIKGFFEANL